MFIQNLTPFPARSSRSIDFSFYEALDIIHQSQMEFLVIERSLSQIVTELSVNYVHIFFYSIVIAKELQSPLHHSHSAPISAHTICQYIDQRDDERQNARQDHPPVWIIRLICDGTVFFLPQNDGKIYFQHASHVKGKIPAFLSGPTPTQRDKRQRQTTLPVCLCTIEGFFLSAEKKKKSFSLSPTFNVRLVLRYHARQHRNFLANPFVFFI